MADVLNLGSCISPDVEILDHHISARDVSRAIELDGSSLDSVRASAAPAGESKVGVKNTVSIDGRHAGPSRIEIQGVGVRMTNEVVQSHI